MKNFLGVYLDSIDEHLLERLDEDDELNLDTVQRLRFYTSVLPTAHVLHAQLEVPRIIDFGIARATKHTSDTQGSPRV